jgi:hypothetical protein
MVLEQAKTQICLSVHPLLVTPFCHRLSCHGGARARERVLYRYFCRQSHQQIDHNVHPRFEKSGQNLVGFSSKPSSTPHSHYYFQNKELCLRQTQTSITARSNTMNYLNIGLAFTALSAVMSFAVAEEVLGVS